MTKYFCDRCGKECEKLIEIMIPKAKTQLGIPTRGVSVCGECEKVHNDILDKLADIRLIMYKDFMKGGVE